MNLKKNFSRSITVAALLILFFIIFNFITNKQEASALIKEYKHSVEVFKTPSCGCCYGYVLFFAEEKFKVK